MADLMTRPRPGGGGLPPERPHGGRGGRPGRDPRGLVPLVVVLVLLAAVAVAAAGVVVAALNPPAHGHGCAWHRVARPGRVLTVCGRP